MQHLQEMEIAVQAAPDRQISLTDPDARAMCKRRSENPSLKRPD
jgi:transposase